VYNIATGKETTINSLAETLIKTTGKALTPIHGPPRQGEIRRSVADISKAKTQLHFTPKTNLENDLRELWNWSQA
jgi:UDP-glucose 4-epimerase